jgi:hypothetical protein
MPWTVYFFALALLACDTLVLDKYCSKDYGPIPPPCSRPRNLIRAEFWSALLQGSLTASLQIRTLQTGHVQRQRAADARSMSGTMISNSRLSSRDVGPYVSNFTVDSKERIFYELPETSQLHGVQLHPSVICGWCQGWG